MSKYNESSATLETVFCNCVLIFINNVFNSACDAAALGNAAVLTYCCIRFLIGAVSRALILKSVINGLVLRIWASERYEKY